MAKKILIEYDIDSKDLKIAGQETLSLTQQLRILKKELQRGDLKPEQFDILRKKIGDTEDQIARTTTRSKDFLGVLATLPGPVGTFGASILGVVDTLKVFSGFSFKDIKNSLGDLADDVVEITNGFFGLGEAKKKTEEATQSLTTATQESVVATQNNTSALAANATQGAVVTNAVTKQQEALKALAKENQLATVVYDQNGVARVKATKSIKDMTSAELALFGQQKAAIQQSGVLKVKNMELAGSYEASIGGIVGATTATNALTAAQRAAAFAGQALKVVLASLGIGLIIIAVTELISLLGEWVSGTKEAERAQKEFNNELERTTTLLELDLNDTRRRNAIRLAELKAAGASEKEIRNQQLKELKENLALVNQAVTDAANLENATLKRTDEKAVEDYNTISKKRTELEQKAKDISTQIRVAELTGIADDNKKRLELNKKAADDEYNRKLKELDALIQLEVDKDNTDEKRLADYLDRKMKLIMTKEKLSAAEQQLMRQQNAQKVKQSLDEDAQRLLDYFKKIEDIRIDALEDEEQARIEARENKVYFDKVALSKDKEFLKKSKEEQDKVFKDLEIAAQQDILKIREEFFLKRFQQEQQQAIATIELLTKLKEQENSVNAIRLQQLGNFNAVYGDYFFGNKGLKALYAQYFVDLRQVYTDEFNANTALFDAEQAQLDQALANKSLSQEKYNEQIRELNEKRLQNSEEFTQRQIQLDQLEVDSKRASADKTVEIGAQLVNLLSAVAGKSKGIQIAAAITEAGVAIARIIIDTQRAIIAFSASVAPLGPAGVPIAAGYAVKAKIAAALSIATIVAQGINKLKEIKSQGSEEGGGQQSNRLGRGYADGGIVRGPGGPKSDSINARLSNGEAVMTAGAVTMFAPLLSMMNQMGGGASFTNSLNAALPDKPVVSAPSLDQTPMIVKTYVVEKELTDAQYRQARLKELSTL